MDEDSLIKLSFKENLKNSLKRRENQILAIILAFAVIVRIYYFFRLGAQPIWWDEGDYLAIAKVWALGMPTPEWWSHFSTIRPLLLPIIWAGMFKIGLSEIILRFFTLLIPSIATVYLVYAVGRDLYNKKTGLIAALMISIYWVFMFYSFRLLTDIPAIFLGMLSIYFFWSKYITKGKNFGLYLSILFGVLAFTARFPLALVLISIAIYLLFTKKLALFKEKTIWKAVALGFVLLLPYFIYFIYTKFGLFTMYFGANANAIRATTSISNAVKDFGSLIPQLLHPVWFIFLIIGLVVLLSKFIFFDLIWKQTDKKFNGDLFVFILTIVHVFFFVAIIQFSNDRWVLMLMPGLFYISANGMLFIYRFIKKYEKNIALVFLLIVVLFGAYQQYQHTATLIDNKKDTYLEIKLAGEWLKANTLKDSKIITASIVQNQYYSERESYDFNSNITLPENCTDPYGGLNTSETCQKLSEAGFNKKIAILKPDYMIVSVFEPVFTPQWAYTYPERYNMTPVQGYVDQNKNPILIIYKFKSN